jgi:phospholipid/cholesterol/gamma-HCH transport system substrate-binding protein
METRASHLLIGIFVVLFTSAIFGFITWLVRAEVDREVAYYDVEFTSAVSGLGIGGDVRFNGVKVGAVSSIRIDREDPRKVRVRVEIGAETPVRADSVATLELQGVTGVSYVQISAGSSQATMLPARSRGEIPVIASKPSRIAELFEGAPDLINRSIVLVDRVADLVNEQNRKHFGDIVADLRALTGAVARREQEIGRIIEAFERGSADLSETARSMRSVAAKMDGILDKAGGTMSGVDDLVRDSRRAAAALASLSEEAHAILAENRRPIENFTGDGLSEIRRFVNEARILVGSIARVAARIEDDPSQVLFGSRESEFKLEKR